MLYLISFFLSFPTLSSANAISLRSDFSETAEICRAPGDRRTSQRLEGLKKRAIESVVFEGRPLTDEAALLGAAMSDIRVKRDYYRELAKTRKSAWFPTLGKIFEQKKQDLLDYVDLRFAGLSEAIKEVRLVPFESFLDQDIAKMEQTNRVFFLGWGERGARLEAHCRLDGLALSAFYYAPEKVVVLCPGLELRVATGEASADGFEFLLAHEISHAVDTLQFPEVNRVILSGTSYPEVFWPELSADYWAAKVLTKGRPDRTSANLSLLCGLPEVTDGFNNYPSGEERIKFILKYGGE